MTLSAGAKAPTLFWVTAVGAVIWNLMGVAAFFTDLTMSAETLAALPEAQRQLLEQTPAWEQAAFAIAVFAGLGGSILLLLRHRLAAPTLGLSLAGVLVQMLHNYVLADTLAVLGASSLFMPALILAIAVGLYVFARFAGAKGWLR